MKNFKNKFIFIITTIFIFIAFIILFVIDIGINSKYFIKKDFKTTYEYLITGDCDSFNKFLRYENNLEYCKKINNNPNGKLKSVAIKNLSHNFYSNEVFLSTEYTILKNDGKERKFIQKSKMTKTNFRRILGEQ